MIPKEDFLKAAEHPPAFPTQKNFPVRTLNIVEETDNGFMTLYDEKVACVFNTTTKEAFYSLSWVTDCMHLNSVSSEGNWVFNDRISHSPREMMNAGYMIIARDYAQI